MTKKQIWIYEEDYEKLKSFGKPGESVADWMKHSMENFIQMRADLSKEKISAKRIDAETIEVYIPPDCEGEYCEINMKA